MTSASEKTFLTDEKAVFAPAHTALIIVDMQKDFCDPDGLFARAGRDISGVRDIIPNIQNVLRAARRRDVFIVYMKQITLPLGRSDNDAWLAFKQRDRKSPEYTLHGSPGAEIIPELAPDADDVIIQKHRPSSFHGTFLDQILRANGVRSVLVTGTTTEGCVMATVLDASFHDYYTGVVRDGVASSVDKMQETALAFMETRYKILTAAQVAELWR
jgi:nicotinamidase-related amidase